MDTYTHARRITIAAAALVLGSASGWATPPAMDRSAPIDPVELSAVEASFVEAALGLDDGRRKVAGRDIGVAARQHPDWGRPAAQLPAALAETEHPAYYVYAGRPVEMPVDGARLVVKMHPGADDPRAAAAAAGLAAESRHLGFGDWHLLDVANAAPDAEHVAACLGAVCARPQVDFAAPVFVNPDVEGGWLSVTRDVLVRVQPEFLHGADALVAEAAPDLVVVDRDFAGLPGVFRLRSETPDGFGVLRAANRLATDPRFAWAEPELIGSLGLDVIPNDPAFDSSWALHNTGQQGCCSDIDIDAPEAWDIANGDWTVKVLVLDTGVQQDHPDLNLVTGRDFTDGTAEGFGDGGPLGVCDSHGTAVAGCIAGKINNNLGSTGIAPDSRVVSARIGSQVTNPCDIDFATVSSTWIANALDWGYGQGIPITNSSFGVSSSSVIEDAYGDTWSNGVLHFASAGNGGSDAIGDPVVSFPARLGTVNGVAALDRDGTRTTFSNWGTGLDFAAPGLSIFTTDRTAGNGYSGGDYTWVSGTSFASPLTAGSAALVWSALPEYSATAIEFWLQDTAVDLGVAGYDTSYGWGIPNPRAALNGPGPFNNFCANAWPIFSPVFGPLPFDTTQATAFGEEPQEWCEWNNSGVSNSVWFAFFAPCSAVVDINTNGSDYDTVVSLWVGDCTTAFPVACDDDSGTGWASQLTDVPVSGDNIYMIKVSDYNPSAGGGMLDFDFLFHQPNDECADAVEIAAGTTQFCTLGATDTFLQPFCSEISETMTGDVWFTHTATQDGDLTVFTCGLDGYDTQLAVYQASQGLDCPFIDGGAVLLACNDDAPGVCTAVSSQVTVPVQTGRRYTIRVSGHPGPAGDGNLTLVYETCPEDTNGDGLIDVGDLLDVLGLWGTADPDADVNDDGVVDVNDLLELLARWGAC